MNINVLNGISYFNNNPVNKNNKFTDTGIVIKEKYDTFNSSIIKKQKNVSFNGLFSNVFNKKENNSSDEKSSKQLFNQKLTEGLKKEFEIDIPVENLKNVYNGDDLKRILPNIKTQNFISSKKNQEEGTYCIDLDYITSFSYNGIEDTFDVLDNAAHYANYHYAKTGKNFIFSITDTDNIEGLMHSLAYIGENPHKFEHLIFVPGIKLSFAHKAPNSSIGYENSKMLVYGINPFSENINSFVDNTFNRRKDMVYDFIQNASELYKTYIYKISEFSELNDITLKKDLGQSNLYWRIREYISSKGDTDINDIQLTPEEIYAFSEDIFAGMDAVFTNSDDVPMLNIFKNSTDNNNENILLQKLFEKYSTHYNSDKHKIESYAENFYNELIKCLSKEKDKPVMCIASPYYFSHYFENPNAKSFENVVSFFEFLQRKSKGMLIGFESIAPEYDLDKRLTPKDIINFNDYIRKNTKLLEVGGSFATRDNSDLRLIP